MIANCPRGSGSSRNPQGSGRGGSNVLLQTQNKGKGRSGSQGRGSASETINRPATTAPAQAYAMRAREDPDIPGVIAGTFSLLILTCMLELILAIRIHIYSWNK